MFYYFPAFVIYGISLFGVSKMTTRSPMLIFSFGLLPFFLLAICRGNVGIDTDSYVRIIGIIRDGGGAGLEIGFVLLVKALLRVGMGSHLILSTIVVIVTVMLIYTASLSKQSLLLIAFCIVPVFYLDMVMNGIRYGLAFSCAMCASALFYQRRLYFCLLLATCSVLFHISGWLIIALMTILADDKTECKKWLWITAITGFFVGLHIGGAVGEEGEYFSNKIQAYAKFSSPSILSGLSTMFLSLLAWWFIKKMSAFKINKIIFRQLCVLLIGIGATFLIAKFTYAGLRLQFVLLFSILIYAQFKPALDFVNDAAKYKLAIRALSVFAALASVVFIKNMLVSEGVGPSPWLPYSVNQELLYFIKEVTG